MIATGELFVVERDGLSWSVYRRRGEGREREPIKTFAAFSTALRFAADSRADAIRKAAMDSPESEKP